jgi:hypothetical protein
MSSSRNKRIGAAFAFAVCAGRMAFGLAGCIADRAEDTELPWSSGQSWEGMAPIAPSMMNRYD